MRSYFTSKLNKRATAFFYESPVAARDVAAPAVVDPYSCIKAAELFDQRRPAAA
jgi:hypothetical protein